MIPFLALTAFALSAWLLFDLVAGARQSRETQQQRWQRAMSALSNPSPESKRPESNPSPESKRPRPPVQRPAPTVESQTGPVDLVA